MANGVRAKWQPAPDTGVTQYQLYSAADASAAEALVDTIPNDPAGPNYDPALKQFFYDDPQGTLGTLYRAYGVDADNVIVYDTGRFWPASGLGAGVEERRRVDHNFGVDDALRYVAPSGAGVPQAIVRAYKKVDYDQGRNDLAVAITQTLDDGRWAAPLFLEPGFDYVIMFEKKGAFGPDLEVVTV